MNTINKKISIPLFFIIFIFLSGFTVSNKLEFIPKNDLNYIQFFFNYLVYDTPSPYTLFGSKPISIVEFGLNTKPYLMRRSSKIFMLRKCFNIWKKYSYLFPSDNYIFLENYTLNKRKYCILLINKPLCLKTIEKNLNDFHQILENKIEASEILSMIEHSDCLFKTLKYNQGLLGLLLGFGKNNSFAFHDIYVNKMPLKRLNFFDENDGNPFLLFRTLNFAVFDESETVNLKYEYKKQQEQIITQYQNYNLLERTLEKYTEIGSKIGLSKEAP